MELYRKIDADGFYIGDEFIQGEEITAKRDGTTLIDAPPPQGFYRPKWNGEKWVEGETEQERAERNKEVLKIAIGKNTLRGKKLQADALLSQLNETGDWSSLSPGTQTKIIQSLLQMLSEDL